MVTCEQRLLNAGKLISLLAGEGKRWEDSIIELRKLGKFIVGDVFMATCELSYLGPFTGTYRENLLKQWLQYGHTEGVDISEKYSLVQTLGDQVEIREWTMSGLPSDSVSIDNAIMSTQTAMWPLMIDPQSQANTWIKKREEGLLVLKAFSGDQVKL